MNLHVLSGYYSIKVMNGLIVKLKLNKMGAFNLFKQRLNEYFSVAFYSIFHKVYSCWTIAHQHSFDSGEFRKSASSIPHSPTLDDGIYNT